MKKLIISCMDYRLSEEILKRADNNTLIIRNAGANVFELKDKLRNMKDIGEVIFLPHTDCAAMKLVNSILKEGKNVDNEITEKLVKPFENASFNNLQELEKLNLELQYNILKDIFPNAKIEAELIDINKLNIPKRNPIYYLLKPESRYSKEMIGSYIIQSFDKESVSADLKIADILNLKMAKSEL
ncbi:carbonic anhydrase [Acidianus sulfidivorans JP7]|uniref:Carbonic anhydrase n=1 Tax=Acidianus sulfidivorans JP7 TaxID=619593 RepID=A0A2U9IN90_9CREN|nr:carbonic anhydrase [Acidianus sulfidivorans]AWR97480.1 carbonic anhydrase [Acidianus sulfidivorans JP7]